MRVVFLYIYKDNPQNLCLLIKDMYKFIIWFWKIFFTYINLMLCTDIFHTLKYSQKPNKRMVWTKCWALFFNTVLFQWLQVKLSEVLYLCFGSKSQCPIMTGQQLCQDSAIYSLKPILPGAKCGGTKPDSPTMNIHHSHSSQKN